MGYHFLPCDRRPTVFECRQYCKTGSPESDLTWFLLNAVAQINLAVIEQTYRRDGRGQAA
jgi:hypothetical protein